MVLSVPASFTEANSLSSRKITSSAGENEKVIYTIFLQRRKRVSALKMDMFSTTDTTAF